MSDKEVKIEILSLEGCSGTPPTKDLVKAVSADLGIGITLTETKINTVQEANDHRFPGSPTVRVNGLDVEPAMRDVEQSALT